MLKTVLIIESENMGKNFILKEFIPPGKDEYYLRNIQTRKPKSGWRHLRSDEVEQLVKNDNKSDSWDNILVTGEFDTNLIKNTQFFGLVRIGRLRHIYIQHHDLKVPAYWWMYNMYAFARNISKFQSRDKRISKVQHIEYESFAPDTAEEIFHALRLLEIWTAKAALKKEGKSITGKTDQQLAEKGRKLLMDDENPFRRSTFRNEDEMNAAIGTIDDNSFIIQVRKETEEFEKFVKKVLKRE